MWRQLSILLLLTTFASIRGQQDEVKLVGQYLRIENESIEMVYQLPPVSPIKGVLALFHGCSHRATDFWPASDSCKKCIGLPVERTIALAALRRGLAVLAISSSNSEHKCWIPHQGASDDVGEGTGAFRG